MNDEESPVCCYKRKKALEKMLEWYYKDPRGYTYGPVDTFRVVYFIYSNYFEETTPFAPCSHGRMTQSGFQRLKMHLPLLQKDFLDNCDEVFACSHYMDRLVQGPETTDTSIPCLPVSPRRSTSSNVIHIPGLGSNIEPKSSVEAVNASDNRSYMHRSRSQSPGYHRSKSSSAVTIRTMTPDYPYPSSEGEGQEDVIYHSITPALHQLSIATMEAPNSDNYSRNYESAYSDEHVSTVHEQLHADVAIPVRLTSMPAESSNNGMLSEEHVILRDYQTAVSFDKDFPTLNFTHSYATPDATPVDNKEESVQIFLLDPKSSGSDESADIPDVTKGLPTSTYYTMNDSDIDSKINESQQPVGNDTSNTEIPSKSEGNSLFQLSRDDTYQDVANYSIDAARDHSLGYVVRNHVNNRDNIMPDGGYTTEEASIDHLELIRRKAVSMTGAQNKHNRIMLNNRSADNVGCNAEKNIHHGNYNLMHISQNSLGDLDQQPYIPGSNLDEHNIFQTDVPAGHNVVRNVKEYPRLMTPLPVPKRHTNFERTSQHTATFPLSIDETPIKSASYDPVNDRNYYQTTLTPIALPTPKMSDVNANPLSSLRRQILKAEPMNIYEHPGDTQLNRWQSHHPGAPNDLESNTQFVKQNRWHSDAEGVLLQPHYKPGLQSSMGIPTRAKITTQLYSNSSTNIADEQSNNAMLQAQQMLIKQRLQSNLRETQAHLSRIASRKVSHLFSSSQGDLYVSQQRHST
ncbi:hypothetical protein BBOV_III008160 [Babesia bovis T2Bo]|uniref:GYF domain-containing protein n=1 Tax=Babesia bovis TaxID=5865 RepID=A7AP92_BABBO|nr:hypothetical protein BBOV_III008160 [Babesia bovis T2Bo]EDO08376.1 hypothetical protein BBOV_III008160 [Babesia bovis T2Bo]|eukprot:XP_001611944.1 hypothetical protein [Babesia bovis T2Bo]